MSKIMFENSNHFNQNENVLSPDDARRAVYAIIDGLVVNVNIRRVDLLHDTDSMDVAEYYLDVLLDYTVVKPAFQGPSDTSYQTSIVCNEEFASVIYKIQVAVPGYDLQYSYNGVIYDFNFEFNSNNYTYCLTRMNRLIDLNLVLNNLLRDHFAEDYDSFTNLLTPENNWMKREAFKVSDVVARLPRGFYDQKVRTKIEMIMDVIGGEFHEYKDETKAVEFEYTLPHTHEADSELGVVRGCGADTMRNLLKAIMGLTLRRISE